MPEKRDRSSRFAWTVLGLCVSFAIAACGDDEGGGDGNNAGQQAGERCATGTSYSCFLPRCDDARQLCMSGGTRGPCTCVNGMPGSDGGPDGGQSGMGGMAGRDPRAGSSGDDGMRDAAVPVDGGDDPDTAPDASSDAGDDEPDASPDAGDDEPELCDNGDDDDGDGDTDCADDDCDTSTCVPTVPDDWSGPVVLHVGSGEPPECEDGFSMLALEAGTEVDAEDAECSTCTCTPESSTCGSLLNFETTTATDCSGVACASSLSASCATLSTDCLDAASAGVRTKLPSGLVGCTASTQAPQISSVSWEERVLACTPADELVRGGCAAGLRCAPEPPFAGELCIYRDGDHDCPSGDYDDRRVYFSEHTDTRSCSDCACEKDCSYGWQIFDHSDDACETPLAVLDAPEQCAQVSPSEGAIRVGVSVEGSGDCTASGGEPEGSVSATEPVTVCCLQ